MEKILLVGSTPLFTENVHFLLSLAGFELVAVRNIEEAINLIGIKQSFHMLIFPRSELVNEVPGYFGFINKLASRVKVLVVERKDGDPKKYATFDDFIKKDDMYFCDSVNIVSEVKKIFGRA